MLKRLLLTAEGDPNPGSLMSEQMGKYGEGNKSC